MTEPYWGKGTSTLDWCEENYVVCKYIAEFWNTTTNLTFVILALFGIVSSLRNLGEKRFVLCYLGMLMVGIGSWFFHMTLLYEMQLLDELPMIYCTCFCLYSVLEMGHKPQYGIVLPLALLTYSGLVTAIYLYNRDPVFHQVSYALEVAVIVFRNAYLLSQIPDGHVNQDGTGRTVRSVLRSLFIQSAVTFLLGFALWNVDNAFCTQLRFLRAQVGAPFDILFQLHGWWHIFTALGCYLCILNTEYMRMAFLDKLTEFELSYLLGIVPYIRRRKTIAARKTQ
ncbi:alkaline ceramidase ydc1 [Dimargaris cristalligena]|uniref:Alkaline ceramidase n=1 Tax=Dimargaris cristalligena TaxID=215637 RepID=A0A4P9ZWN4_9FUNG|nr:alkaline ceramidase ydc1 [Dimargaris cristalligena]RKP37272.1 alkaline ceramidase [Dimargaris cristalligena]|eukprot:RKP37272.1 alkaline ceramidase [Dimargaris cristalligena]